MKKVAVIQSNYIPWKGYFDIINDVDIFIFYDDVQYTKNDWRNRNKLKSPHGSAWITVPTGQKLNRLICEVELSDSSWQLKHLKTIKQLYSKAPYFKKYLDFLEFVYLENRWMHLSELNQFLIKTISKDILGAKVEFQDSRQYSLTGNRLERLANLLHQVGTDIYLSGPSAKSYIDEAYLQNFGIRLQYKDYSSYPEYSQLYPPFEHFVSIFDLLLNCGPDAPYYIWGWREKDMNGVK
jgi:hypothetical protein